MTDIDPAHFRQGLADAIALISALALDEVEVMTDLAWEISDGAERPTIALTQLAFLAKALGVEVHGSPDELLAALSGISEVGLEITDEQEGGG